MERISRENYLSILKNFKDQQIIKVITGIRRCGKSYLLDPIFKDYLIGQGVKEDHIIKLSLDERANSKYLDPDVLDEYIRSLIVDDKKYYLILDEIQQVKDYNLQLKSIIKVLSIYSLSLNILVFI